MKNMHAALAAALAAALLAPLSLHAAGLLENPADGGYESGIGAITGWHCTARQVELRMDGASMGFAGTGTPRLDTQSTCGRSDTGFSLLFNYSLLRGGTHRVDAYADGQWFGSATFTAGYAGTEFLTGAAATHDVADFPSKGSKARIVWSQAKQNFVITGTASMSSGAIAGQYSLRQMSGIDTTNYGMSSMQPGVSVSGTFNFVPGGTYSGSITLVSNGSASTSSLGGTWSDQGYYIMMDGAPAPIIERGETLAFQMIGMSGGTATSMVFSLGRLPETNGSPRAAKPSTGGEITLGEFIQLIEALRP